MPTYTVGLPFDGQSLGNSKPQVRDNFTVLFNTLAVNHIPMNNMGAGKHAFVEMPNQPILGGPTPVTLMGESALYSAAYGPTPFANWIYQQENGGADPLRNQGASIQMTGIKPSATPKGWTFLPGGLLLQWDNPTTAPNSSGNTTINLPQPFNDVGSFFSVVLTSNSTPATFLTLSAGGRTASSFVVNQVPDFGAYSFFYMAIGFGA